jgi:ArsR family transcriptional regulator
MASALAAGAQQLPASAAASAVPQQVLAAASAVAAVDGPPQQPLAAGGVNASAGSPMNPPPVVWVVMGISFSEVGWRRKRNIADSLSRWISNQPRRKLAPCFEICQPRGMSKQKLPVIELQTPCCSPISESAMTSADAIELAPAFKALGDPVRLQLMSMIASHAGGEVCVCDLTPAFELSGPTISHHLKVLREAGLVDCERRGTWVYYWPIQSKLGALSTLLAAPMPVAA